MDSAIADHGPQDALGQWRLARETLQYYAAGFLAPSTAIQQHVPWPRSHWISQDGAIDMLLGNAVLPMAVQNASACKAQVFLTHSQGLLAVLVEFLANGFKVLDIVPCHSTQSPSSLPENYLAGLDKELNDRFRGATFDTFESMVDQLGGSAHRDQFASLLTSRLMALAGHQ